MHKLFTLASCLLLGACAGTQPAVQQQTAQAGSGAVAMSARDAIHNTQAIPLPINPGLVPPQWPIGAEQPRMAFGSSIANYRVFSLQLKKGERYRLNLNSRCHDTCLGFNKFALKPRALLLDAYGAVIASQPSRSATVVGEVSLGWDGEAPEDGTYYLLVAADREDIGKTIVIDDVWLNNSPLMAVEVGMSRSPFDQLSAFAAPRHE